MFKEYYAGGGLGETGYRYKKAFFENLPIPKYTGSEIQKQIYNATKESDIETLVYQLYRFTIDEISQIENTEA